MGITDIKKILPAYLFWDMNFKELDMLKDKKIIIDRILKFGSEKEINWLLSNYSQKDIVDIIKFSKNIDKKTTNFWSIHYSIPKEDIWVLNNQFLQECFY